MAILVPAAKGESKDGFASFAGTVTARPVRLFRESEQERCYLSLPEPAKEDFVAIHSLLAKIEKGDADLDSRVAAAQRVIDSKKLLEQLTASMERPTGKTTQQLGVGSTARVVLYTAERRALVDALLGTAGAGFLPEWALSLAVSAKLAKAFPVLWWTGEPPTGGIGGTYDAANGVWEVPSGMKFSKWRGGGAFIPAIFCAELETALYVSALFRRSLTVCLHCRKVFRRTKKTKYFCCPQHRDVYRVNRWRRMKKKGGA